MQATVAQHGPGELRLAPVAGEHVRSAHDDFSGVAGRQRAPRVINDKHL
ncbi:hypothetical protein AWB74_08759 [Caballeronia arvi]|uniref:Uncharacterized protein n=1 Tax=Caballeronia arvi TaxID=1777135 RepID=A0A158L6A2_9BURK|nr:hypothetical protein AWB74_08759 [Caballeronia arvi]